MWKNPNSKFHTIEFKQKKREIALKKFKDPEYLKKFQNGLHNKPTRPEKIILELLTEIKTLFKFVGDYSFWIDGKNPYFIDRENNKIIEVFSDYYHDISFRKTIGNMDSNEDHIKKRIEHFEKHGYKCIVIWEKDIIENIDLVRHIIEDFLKQ
jgi:hypothetical protein